MSRLKIEGLRFRDLGPFDLEVAAGECVAMSGPSGAGKSLLLRAIADLDSHSGQLWIDAAESTTLPAPAWRRRVGLLPSESRWWRDRVEEHFPAGPPPGLERLGFGPEALGWAVARLSSGERQRLGLLRLLANRPDALLLDEPTANLDAGSMQRVESLLAEYREQSRAAVLWVTHDREQARRVARRCLRLEAGRLVPESAA